MPIPAVVGAAGAAAGNAALDFGMGMASSALYAQQVRELRRTAYQDMVHSLKQAGLNPVLAAGASPGNSAGYQIQVGKADLASNFAKPTTAKAAKKQADTAESVADVQKDMMGTASSLNTDLGAKAVADKKLADSQRIKTEQDARTSAAQQRMYEAQSGQLDASAAESAARITGIKAENIGKVQEGEVYEGRLGAALKYIDAFSKAAQGIRGGAGR